MRARIETCPISPPTLKQDIFLPFPVLCYSKAYRAMWAILGHFWQNKAKMSSHFNGASACRSVLREWTDAEVSGAILA
jgi:hypothetical protein